MTDWKSLSSNEKVSVIKGVYAPGISTAHMASMIGVTRNAVIGLYHRNKELQKSCPLMERRKASSKASKGIAPKKRSVVKRRSVPATQNKSAAPVSVIPDTTPPVENPSLDLPLHELNRGMCKWPVNNGSPFLFCGNATEETYCPYHRSRA